MNTPSEPPRSFGVLLLALSGALIVNSAIGPLGVDVVFYPFSATIRNQLIGLELVTLALVVPWCAAAGFRTLAGKNDAAVLALGPTAYTVYMFIQYVLGPEYGEYRGLVLFHLLLVTLSGTLALWAWALSRDTALPFQSRRTDRACAAVLVGLSLLVVLRYADALKGAVDPGPIPIEFLEARTFYWSIFLLDLGVVVPLTLVGAVALLRARRLGRRMLLLASGWFALVPPSVAAMAVTMLINDDANASWPTVWLLIFASAMFGAFAVFVYRPLLSHRFPA